MHLTDYNQDGFFSAQELIQANPAQNWTSPPEDFTAQTTIAASYGPMHLLYREAVLEVHWNNGNGGHPADLLLPDISLPLATGLVLRKFLSCTSQNHSPQYNSFSAWRDGQHGLREMLRRYNGKYTYADAALNYADSYAPK